MNYKRLARILPVIMVLLLLITAAPSCITIKRHKPVTGTGTGTASPTPPRGPTGTINTGASVAIASQTINPTGGTIAVQKPGDPLDGLQIISTAQFLSGCQAIPDIRSTDYQSFLRTIFQPYYPTHYHRKWRGIFRGTGKGEDTGADTARPLCHGILL